MGDFDRITGAGETLGEIAADIRGARGVRLVALTGRAGAGKSTAAAGLVFRHRFTRARFAGPLKAMARALFASAGFIPADVEDMIEGARKETPVDALGGLTPRRVMQTLGTEWGRDTLAPDFWVDLWRAGAVSALEAGNRLVVEDCRFENEAAAVRALGGVVVEITRPDLAPLAAGHASERGVVADVSIPNDGPRARLDARLSECLDDLARSHGHA